MKKTLRVRKKEKNAQKEGALEGVIAPHLLNLHFRPQEM
jgi:hypothetical protein